MVTRSPEFEKTKQTFVDGLDDYKKYRDYYYAVYQKNTTLTDDDIADVVAKAEDDQEPVDWANDMLVYEKSIYLEQNPDAAGG